MRRTPAIILTYPTGSFGRLDSDDEEAGAVSDATSSSALMPPPLDPEMSHELGPGGGTLEANS